MRTAGLGGAAMVGTRMPRRARAAVGAMAMVAIVALVWVGPAVAAVPITGTITDTSATPLEGIVACAISPPPTTTRCDETDAAGEYSIAEAGPGDTMHFFGFEDRTPSVAPQWFPGKAHPEEAVPVSAGDIAAGIDVVMAKGATVEGEVLDLANEAPVQGVEVCPNPTVFRAGEALFCAHSGPDGKFVLRNLAGGEYDFGLSTAGHVNYVDDTFTGISIPAGSSKGLGFYMRRGVEVDGTMTVAGNATPVESLGAPYLPPRVCAVSIETGEAIKCTTLAYAGGGGGAWSIPGIPPNQLFTLSFAIDYGSSDGWIGQWWNGVASLDKATAIIAGGGNVITHRDAFLLRGEDPRPTTQPSVEEEHRTGTGTIDPPVVTPSNPLAVLPTGPTPTPALKCKKGFRKVTKSGHQRCVKIKKKHRPRKHHHKKAADAHRLPARVQ